MILNNNKKDYQQQKVAPLKGVIFLELKKENGDVLNEDALMEFCLDAAAQDVEIEGNFATIIVECNDFYSFVENLKQQNYKFVSADLEYIPEHFVEIKQKDNLEKMKKLADMLRDDEDILNIWTNCKNY